MGDLIRGGVPVVVVAAVAVAVVDLLAADSKIETDIAAFRSLSIEWSRTDKQTQGVTVTVSGEGRGESKG